VLAALIETGLVFFIDHGVRNWSARRAELRADLLSGLLLIYVFYYLIGLHLTAGRVDIFARCAIADRFSVDRLLLAGDIEGWWARLQAVILPALSNGAVRGGAAGAASRAPRLLVSLGSDSCVLASSVWSSVVAENRRHLRVRNASCRSSPCGHRFSTISGPSSGGEGVLLAGVASMRSDAVLSSVMRRCRFCAVRAERFVIAIFWGCALWHADPGGHRDDARRFAMTAGSARNLLTVLPGHGVFR